ncbi:MAG: hypothetical protein IJ025_04480 [Clostridia bacterium]|nr:hypothetical protein [Clostridia bacterium]
MTKSDYLSNSAKLLLICSGFLFVVNSLAFFGMYSDVLSEISAKLTTACFYIVLVLGFLAFNGEGIAYKHSRQPENKKKTLVLKILLLSAFFIRFIKIPVENAALSFDSHSFSGVISRLFLGVFNTVASYGFLLTIVALWYIFRDSGVKKLLLPECVSFFTGVLYNVYKMLNYSVTRYGLDIFGEFFVSVFGNGKVMSVLCLIHFLCDIVMFILVLLHYNRQAIAEQKEKAVITNRMITSRKIYSTDCFGLDTLEDDFFLDKQEELAEI